jgi:glycosyltransferase involved in cell wall biosynthesis
MYGKFSVGWWSSVFEQKAMRYINLFTLPAKDRLLHFDVSLSTITTIIVPNFPALRYFFKSEPSPVFSQGNLKMFYQGSLSANHGFEELIPFLGKLLDHITLSMTLIGPIDNEYKELLLAIADKHNKKEYFHILAPVPYAELKSITRQHHIGLAIHKPIGRIYSTGGTASNKIYEYAANGLPVILHDNPHYKQYLGKYEWAFFTDCSGVSIKKEISRIARNYQEISSQARRDFEKELNFETVFSPVKKYLKSKCV